MSTKYPKWAKITHLWFKKDDYRQPIVQRAYDVWGMDLVVLIECENWQRNPFAKWDSEQAYWLCQINKLYNQIPKEYTQDRWYQITYCNEKRLWWTPFYWPDRILKSWKKCSAEVGKRFLITNS